MSKINSFRVINLNYNNNAIRIEDEIFHMDGESTLLSLQNGGGKSVMVQMLLAPFVRKRYRDTADRPFASYFTTNRPTFLLIEWVFDGGAGYVLTGMMVRRMQETGEQDSKDELEMVNIIHEYKSPNEYDINNLPIIEIIGNEKKLKGFHACKLMFEGIRKEKGRAFQYFDMNQQTQQRQYFDRLKEYQINHTEWESIVKKVNLKESGLSELFRDSKDEAGLIEKWFLSAVESKLNKDENRMKEFAGLLYKFIKQYKDNQSKMERKKVIIQFQTDSIQIKEMASSYQDASNQKLEYEAKIAFLRNNLMKLTADMALEHKITEEKLRDLDVKLKSIQYEEDSYQIYCLMDELEVLRNAQEAKADEHKQLQEVIDQLEFKIHTLECAKLYEDYNNYSKEVLLLENQLDVLRKDEAELLPERNQIGYNLRLHYEDSIEKQKQYIHELEEKILEKQQELEKYTADEIREQNQVNDLKIKLGSYQEKIKSYDKDEQDFSRRYETNLTRNILGVYEEGTLELLKDEFTEALENCKSDLAQLKNSSNHAEESFNSCSRDIEDRNSELGSLKNQLLTQENQLGDYEKQIEIRKVILRFLGVSEEAMFDLPLIEQEFDKKITELTELKRPLDRQLDDLEEEYNRLKTGKVLELPKEFTETLHQLDLSFIYGMDWLSKNGKSQEENEKIIKQVPLLPYSIIMSEKDLVKLSKSQINYYTSFPIPIIKRETLANLSEEIQGCLYDGTQVSFFVVFNHHLLNEEALRELLIQKENDTQKVKKLINQKNDELKMYGDKWNVIKFQTVNKSNYSHAKKQCEEINHKLTETEQTLISLRNRKDEVKKLLIKLADDIRYKTEQEGKFQNKIVDFLRLDRLYQEYRENRALLERTNTTCEGLTKSIQTYKTMIRECNRFISEYNASRERGNDILEGLKNKAVIYQTYMEGELLNKDLEDLEARYEAITQNISEGQAKLEERLEKERARFQKSQDSLLGKEKHYKLSEADYIHIKADEYLERVTDNERKIKIDLLNKLNLEINKVNTEKAVCKNRISESMRALNDRFHTSDLMPREQITDLEFRKRIKLIQAQKDTDMQHFKLIEEKEMGYQNNLSNLSEFNNLTTTKSFTLEEYLHKFSVQNMKDLSGKDLSDFRGMLIRDYRSAVKYEYEKREDLLKLMESIVHKAVYEEDFFRKPIAKLFDVVDTPNSILEQLDIILSSFEALLKKLEVDIELVDKEKVKIVDMLLDYIYEVHRNLSKIDRNSTITVHDRPVKMLRLKLLEWEEHENIFRTRLDDLIEEVTGRGILRLQNNENIEEMLGAYITTKNLYDTVVGINTIGIKLYKIEAQREYPISWAEVAKNSGGEGFLSAFVVLSSLLSYMRREEADLFIEREEGKVLVMDNPFAQTNAAHLLKPLMDIAKKSNTQLICLSGLGGESIYNRFDNIYVLNLLNSGIQKDVTYLKGDHIKGDEEHQLLRASYIKVEEMDQMELLF